MYLVSVAIMLRQVANYFHPIRCIQGSLFCTMLEFIRLLAQAGLAKAVAWGIAQALEVVEER